MIIQPFLITELDLAFTISLQPNRNGTEKIFGKMFSWKLPQNQWMVAVFGVVHAYARNLKTTVWGQQAGILYGQTDILTKDEARIIYWCDARARTRASDPTYYRCARLRPIV